MYTETRVFQGEKTTSFSTGRERPLILLLFFLMVIFRSSVLFLQAAEPRKADIINLQWGRGPENAGGARENTLPVEMDGPPAIAVGPSGDIYILDAINFRILIFSPAGKPHGILNYSRRGLLDRDAVATGLAIGPEHSVYIAFPLEGVVARYSRDMNLEKIFMMEKTILDDPAGNGEILGIDGGGNVYLFSHIENRTFMMDEEARIIHTFPFKIAPPMSRSRFFCGVNRLENERMLLLFRGETGRTLYSEIPPVRLEEHTLAAEILGCDNEGGIYFIERISAGQVVQENLVGLDRTGLIAFRVPLPVSRMTPFVRGVVDEIGTVYIMTANEKKLTVTRYSR